MTGSLNGIFLRTWPQHKVTHDSISFAGFPGPSQRWNPMWFWVPGSPESHVETSWGVPDILCREINHKSTSRDLYSRKKILRIVPSSIVEPSTSKADDFIRAGLWRKEKEKKKKKHMSQHILRGLPNPLYQPHTCPWLLLKGLILSQKHSKNNINADLLILQLTHY